MNEKDIWVLTNPYVFHTEESIARVLSLLETFRFYG